MKKRKKIIVISLAAIMIFSTGVFASQSGLYQMIRDRLTFVGNTYTQKESQLVEDGVNAQEGLSQYMEGLEADFNTELEAYEALLLEEARNELSGRVEEVINLVDGEKEQLLEEIKGKIKEKVDKDLEKELNELEKAIRKEN